MTRIYITLFAIGLISNIQAQEFSWAEGYDASWSTVSALAVDKLGNAYSAVIYGGDVDFDPSADELIYTGETEGTTTLQKLDVDGALLWAKTFDAIGEGNGVMGDGLLIEAMVTDAEHNLYLTGSFTETIDFDLGASVNNIEAYVYSSDAFVMKLNQDGELIWVNTFGAECTETGKDLVIDNLGNICLIGEFCLTVDFNSGPDVHEMSAAWGGGPDVFALKLAPNGDFVWSKSIVSSDYDFAHSIEVDRDGNLFFGGGIYSEADFDPSGDEHIAGVEGEHYSFLWSLNAGGEFQWVQTFKDDTDARVSGIEINTEGDIYAIGNFSGTDIDFDAGLGEFTMSSMGEKDIFILKLNSAGDFIWAKQLGGEGVCKNAKLAISAVNDLYITGQYSGDIDIDPSGTEFILPYSDGDSEDFFLLTLNQDGVYLNALSFNGANADYVVDVVKGAEGSVYLAGETFSSDLDLNPSVEEFIVDSMAYVLKLQDGNVGINSNDPEADITVYPNPTSGDLNIQLEKIYENLQVLILDQTGRVVQRNEFVASAFIQLNIDAPNGIYFVKILSEEMDMVLKISKTN